MLSEPVRAFGSLKSAALGHVVIAYRFYKIDRSDQINGPPHVLECEDDDAVLIEARKIVGATPFKSGGTTREWD